MAMTKEQFKERWESDDEGGGCSMSTAAMKKLLPVAAVLLVMGCTTVEPDVPRSTVSYPERAVTASADVELDFTRQQVVAVPAPELPVIEEPPPRVVAPPPPPPPVIEAPAPPPPVVVAPPPAPPPPPAPADNWAQAHLNANGFGHITATLGDTVALCGVVGGCAYVGSGELMMHTSTSAFPGAIHTLYHEVGHAIGIADECEAERFSRSITGLDFWAYQECNI